MGISESDSPFRSAEGALEAFNHHSVWFADATRDAGFCFDTLTGLIAREEKKEVPRLEHAADAIAESRRGEFWEYRYPYYWEDIFQETLKESFFISLLSILEFYLENTHGVVHFLQYGEINELSKYRGKALLDKVHNSLSDCIKGEWAGLEWDTMDRLWRIRNSLAHRQGSCFGHRDEETLKEFADETDGISMSNGWLRIESAFCKRALITVREFGLSLGEIVRTDLANRCKFRT